MTLPFFTIGHHKFCVYCGDHATETDHVICVSSQTIHPKPARRRTDFGPIAHCCKSCNHILHDKGFDNFDQRCKHVADNINASTQAVIWTKEEIQKLDISLRRYVEHDQARRLWMRMRADWFQSRDYLLNLEQLAWEPCLIKDNPKFNQEMFDYFEVTLIWVKTLYCKT